MTCIYRNTSTEDQPAQKFVHWEYEKVLFIEHIGFAIKTDLLFQLKSLKIISFQKAIKKISGEIYEEFLERGTRATTEGIYA